ncbi:MAG: hypothetical protein AB1772_06080 [Candidatus Zixiibacteriota bacterium]
MAKMSQNVKEILQIVAFVVVVGILVAAFVAYPLSRTKAYLGRIDLNTFSADSLPANDISAFAGLNATVDTFRVEADGLTTLACAWLTPAPDTLSPEHTRPLRGSVVLLHDERADRNSLLGLASAFLDSGWAVSLYDQRASGLSSAGYHSDGEYEASDLNELIAHLRIRDRVIRPFVAVGFRAGADAALLSAAEEDHFDAVVAVRPYLTTGRWLDQLMAEHDMYWIPFPRSIFKFWYELRSGYAPEYRSLATIRPPVCRALILDSEDQTVSEFVQIAGANQIEVRAVPADTAKLIETMMAYLSL